ncbi:MAG: hypothetical protein K0R12_1246 [Gammaproteobacteria bacterium]|jgi:hypothetical protein|nr:hypothetical protein [Gammaproteobacteria bacterium]
MNKDNQRKRQAYHLIKGADTYIYIVSILWFYTGFILLLLQSSHFVFGTEYTQSLLYPFYLKLPEVIGTPLVVWTLGIFCLAKGLLGIISPDYFAKGFKAGWYGVGFSWPYIIAASGFMSLTFYLASYDKITLGWMTEIGIAVVVLKTVCFFFIETDIVSQIPDKPYNEAISITGINNQLSTEFYEESRWDSSLPDQRYGQYPLILSGDYPEKRIMEYHSGLSPFSLGE